MLGGTPRLALDGISAELGVTGDSVSANSTQASLLRCLPATWRLLNPLRAVPEGTQFGQLLLKAGWGEPPGAAGREVASRT